MKKKFSLAACASIALLSFGCSKQVDVDAVVKEHLREEAKFVDSRIQKLEQRVKDLELENKTLRDEFASAPASEAPALPDDWQQHVAAEIETQLAAALAGQGGGQVAAVQPQVFARQFSEQMAAYEEKQRIEREAEREARREQMRQRREQRDEERFVRMIDGLNLTEQQTQQMRELSKATRETFRAFMHEMREEGTMDREAMRTLRDEALTEVEATASTILNPQQLEEYLGRVYRFNGIDRQRGP